jgi:hypothetical protein
MNLIERAECIVGNKCIEIFVLIPQSKNSFGRQVVDGALLLKWRIRKIGCKYVRDFRVLQW